MQIKVMTYNIQSGKNLAGDRDLSHAAHTIRAESPDILTLNEIQHHTTLSNGHCQAEELAAMLGYSYRFAPAIPFMGGEYGIALLSRFPILDAEVIPVPELEQALRDDWYEPRVHLLCHLGVDGRNLAVLSTHYGLSDGEISLAVAETCRLTEQEDSLVFMGDLNATPNSQLLAPLYRHLRDTANLRGDLLTYPSGEPTEKIDYIFTKGNFHTEKIWVPVSEDSDHRPLCALLEWE